MAKSKVPVILAQGNNGFKFLSRGRFSGRPVRYRGLVKKSSFSWAAGTALPTGKATPLKGKPHKVNPPYPPLSGGQEKAKPPPPGGVATPLNFTPPLRGSGFPRGKPDRGRAVCAKADVVGGEMRFIATPNHTPHRIAFGLTPSALRWPSRGGKANPQGSAEKPLFFERGGWRLRGGGEEAQSAREGAMCAQTASPGGTGPPQGE